MTRVFELKVNERCHLANDLITPGYESDHT